MTDASNPASAPSGDPANDTDRGESPLSFMLHPDNQGFLKLFVQLRVDGKDVFLPFSLFIDP